MDAYTVAALDVITVFAVPNLNTFLAKVVDFFGFGCRWSHPLRLVTQPTSDQLALFGVLSFSAVDISNHKNLGFPLM